MVSRFASPMLKPTVPWLLRQVLSSVRAWEPEEQDPDFCHPPPMGTTLDLAVALLPIHKPAMSVERCLFFLLSDNSMQILGEQRVQGIACMPASDNG